MKIKVNNVNIFRDLNHNLFLVIRIDLLEVLKFLKEFEEDYRELKFLLFKEQEIEDKMKEELSKLVSEYSEDLGSLSKEEIKQIIFDDDGITVHTIYDDEIFISRQEYPKIYNQLKKPSEELDQITEKINEVLDKIEKRIINKIKAIELSTEINI